MYEPDAGGEVTRAGRGEDDLAPAGGAGQHAGGQGRQQTGPHRRGLAAARRADDGQQPGLDQAGHQLRDEPLAAVEQLGIGVLERGQTLVRTGDQVTAGRLHRVGGGPDVAQVEHAGQDVLAQCVELALRLGGGRDGALEPAGGGGGDPGTGRRVDLAGDAVGRHRRDQALVARTVPGVVPDHVGNRVVGQWDQGQRRQPGQLTERRGVGGGQHGQHRPGPAGPDPGRDARDVGRPGVVDIVEDRPVAAGPVRPPAR